ncbi:MAG TPA: glycosyltransferase family 9 protein [Chloroflexota bacterium]
MKLGRAMVKTGRTAGTHFFLLGRDYHLGDLLWLTAVLAEYRRQIQPDRLVVGLPDRPISAILERNPLIDDLLRGEPGTLLTAARQRFHGLILHDLRLLPLALTMLRDYSYRLPWLYYRDLWLEGRGQWLATLLRLGPLTNFRPVLELDGHDFDVAETIPARYVVMAPHVGQYTLPLLGSFWRRIKAWPSRHWVELAHRLRHEGYEPITLGAPGQAAIPGTQPVIGLSIRQVAGVIDRAAALLTVESGLWFVAAARSTPFVIVPWWLPRSINWPAYMNLPHRLAYRDHATVGNVLSLIHEVIDGELA